MPAFCLSHVSHLHPELTVLKWFPLQLYPSSCLTFAAHFSFLYFLNPCACAGRLHRWNRKTKTKPLFSVPIYIKIFDNLFTNLYLFSLLSTLSHYIWLLSFLFLSFFSGCAVLTLTPISAFSFLYLSPLSNVFRDIFFLCLVVATWCTALTKTHYHFFFLPLPLS